MEDRKEKVREALKVIKEECNRCFDGSCFNQKGYRFCKKECLISNLLLGTCIGEPGILLPYHWNISEK